MSRRRIVMTQDQYREVCESRDWCDRNGLTGLAQWYREELAFQAYRRALPSGAREYQVDDDVVRLGGRQDRRQ